MVMKEFELKHGIHTTDQAVARFKRLRRMARARERADQPYEDFLPEMMSLDEFLATVIPTWRSNSSYKKREWKAI